MGDCFRWISGPWIPVGNRNGIDRGLWPVGNFPVKSRTNRKLSKLYGGAVNECTRGKTLTNTSGKRFAREPISGVELFEVPIPTRSRLVSDCKRSRDYNTGMLVFPSVPKL